MERLPLLQDCPLKSGLYEGAVISCGNSTSFQDNFYIIIETYHIADRGDKENVHELEGKKLKQRDVVHIDIANDQVATAGEALHIIENY